MRGTFEQILQVLGNRGAAVKLMLINLGISVDGTLLAAEVEGYPHGFRTKRARVKHGVKEGAFVDMASEQTPWVPTELMVDLGGHDSVVKVNYRPDSPFSLCLDAGELRLVSEELGVACQAALMPLPRATQLEVYDYPAEHWVQVLGADRLGILVYMGCANWFRGDQCKFCDSCATRPGEERALPTLNHLRREFRNSDGTYDHAAWWETIGPGLTEGVCAALKQILADPAIGPHAHLHVMAGNLMDVDFEWDLVLQLSAAVARVTPLSEVDSYLNLLPPPDPEKIRRARGLGYGKLIFNMEVYGEEAFAAICPGKHKLVPFDRYLRRMKQAAKIFGAGKVYSGFIFGAQPVEQLRCGVQEVAAAGIVPDYSSFTPKPGTPWARRPRPDLLDAARFARFLADLYGEHGFSPMYCKRSARSSVMNELCGD